MIGFSDEELEFFSELALPLPLAIRGDFLELVASRIAKYGEQARGPGLVYRVAVEAQRDLLKR